MKTTMNVQDGWTERPAARGQRQVDRASMIAADRLQALSRLDPKRMIGALLFDYAVIALIIIVCERFWSPLLYVVAVMAIGARQIGIASVGLHDGAHRRLLPNRAHNDRLGKFLCYTTFPGLLLAGDTFAVWQANHFQHHRNPNNRHDPEVEFGLRYRWYGDSSWKRAGRLLTDVAGVRFTMLVWRGLRGEVWYQKAVALLLIAVATAAIVLPFYPLKLVGLYWLVPMATWAWFVFDLRELAEHYPRGLFKSGKRTAEVFMTRDVLLSWFDSQFLITRGVNYHLTHHLFPGVPFYRLRELHRLIADSTTYRRSAHVVRGYHRVLAELVSEHGRFADPLRASRR